MGSKMEEKNHSIVEDGRKMVLTKKLKRQNNHIWQNFKDADMDDEYFGKVPGKFNSMWRDRMARNCSSLPFQILLTAFHTRYGGGGITPNSTPQLQLQQHHISIPEVRGDFPKQYPDLDDDSVEEILRRLPLPSLMIAKCVCKAWNTAILATNFDLLNVEENHLFVTQHMVQGFQGIALLSSALNRWFRIPLLPWKTWSCYRTKRYHPRPTQLYLCAVAIGLYLFLDWDDFSYHSSPVIINPITKQRRDLPTLPLHYSWTAGAAVEFIAESRHFQIITLGFEESRPRDLCTLLYNSTTNKWTDVPATPTFPVRFPFRIRNFSETHRWTSAVHNGVVYFTHNYGHHLGCYNIASRKFQFKEIEGGLPPQMNFDDYAKNWHASLPSLVACSGRLFLVGRLQKKAGEGSILGRFPLIKHTLVGIWELHNNKQWSWSLISVTPQDLLEETVKSSHGTDFMVAGASNKIWLTISGSVHVMRLDLRSMEWSVLPGCPPEDLFDCSPRKAVCGTMSIGKLSLFD
ncbi:hypothetical protein SUGI_0778240 [Cryptomeria japonica]|nr:hypothetical protein SUGI_0778240 [Cryptomeria japonica]